MKYAISPPTLPIQSRIQLPASKSIANRVLIVRALTGNPFDIHNLTISDDTKVMLDALANPTATTIDIGAAGTAMRFLTGYYATREGTRTLTGSARMKQRPIAVLVNALQQLGAKISYLENEGCPPISIEGAQMKGGALQIDGSISSQYISSLLMIAPTLPYGLQLDITGNLISKPYIHLTLELMRYFGIQYTWNGSHIEIPYQNYKPRPITVEADWSAASYWYQIVSLSEYADITLKGLTNNSLQGDARIAALFESLNVHTHFTPDGVRLTRTGVCTSYFDYDFTNIPDMAQTFAVTLAMKNIPFKLSGLQSLKIKETDRIAALVNELAKLGYWVTAQNNNTLVWNGERVQNQPHESIHTYDDHRMAMAFAPAAIQHGTITIAEPQVVSKSYPYYWNDLRTAGFQISEL